MNTLLVKMSQNQTKLSEADLFGVVGGSISKLYFFELLASFSSIIAFDSTETLLYFIVKYNADFSSTHSGVPYNIVAVLFGADLFGASFVY